MKITILSSSLNPKSKSLVLSSYAQKVIKDYNLDCTLMDLRRFQLPFCGEDGAYTHKDVIAIKKELASSQAIIVSGPVYNYGVNAVTKNILDLTGDAWVEKPIGFICMAGGQASYMSVMGFANSLMLNFRCWIVPRFVYATPKSFDDTQKLKDENLIERIENLCSTTAQMAKALHHARQSF